MRRLEPDFDTPDFDVRLWGQVRGLVVTGGAELRWQEYAPPPAVVHLPPPAVRLPALAC